MSTFRGFNGTDIVATMNGRVIGNLQSISYSTTSAPTYKIDTRHNVSFENVGFTMGPDWEKLLHSDLHSVLPMENNAQAASQLLKKMEDL
jgi:hypothetical protein